MENEISSTFSTTLSLAKNKGGRTTSTRIYDLPISSLRFRFPQNYFFFPARNFHKVNSGGSFSTRYAFKCRSSSVKLPFPVQPLHFLTPFSPTLECSLSQALIRFRPVEIPLFINFPSRKAKAARSRLIVSVVCVISTTEMRIITKIKARFIHAYTVIFTDDPLENFFFFFSKILYIDTIWSFIYFFFEMNELITNSLNKISTKFVTCNSLF